MRSVIIALVAIAIGNSVAAEEVRRMPHGRDGNATIGADERGRMMQGTRQTIPSKPATRVALPGWQGIFVGFAASIIVDRLWPSDNDPPFD